MTQTDWNAFRRGLLGWYDPDRRPLPWKEAGDPYRVWLSEIILQQTRARQGLPYYERFLVAYPTVSDLAAAPDDEVMKLWEGLGYYSRARNLLRAARRVARELGGRFPDTYAGLLELPGVGPYTAAAIASFAFGRRVAVLDGNVYRVLSRYAGDATPIDTGGARRHYQQIADRALGEEGDPARFNQAIMDFGALVCTPRRADCARCPLATDCRALAEDRVYELPVKAKKLRRRDRYFHYLPLRDGRGRYLIRRRGEGDIWRGLYEFPLVETTTPEAPPVAAGDWPVWLPGDTPVSMTGKPYVQQLTHQRILARFHPLRVERFPEAAEGFIAVEAKRLRDYAFPRLINHYLDAPAELPLGI